MPLLTEKRAAALRAHVYSGDDHSLLYKHALSPLAAYCVEAFTPRWMACVRPRAVARAVVGARRARVIAFAVPFAARPPAHTPPPAPRPAART